MDFIKNLLLAIKNNSKLNPNNIYREVTQIGKKVVLDQNGKKWQLIPGKLIIMGIENKASLPIKLKSAPTQGKFKAVFNIKTEKEDEKTPEENSNNQNNSLIPKSKNEEEIPDPNAKAIEDQLSIYFKNFVGMAVPEEGATNFFAGNNPSNKITLKMAKTFLDKLEVAKETIGGVTKIAKTFKSLKGDSRYKKFVEIAGDSERYPIVLSSDVDTIAIEKHLSDYLKKIGIKTPKNGITNFLTDNNPSNKITLKMAKTFINKLEVAEKTEGGIKKIIHTLNSLKGNARYKKFIEIISDNKTYPIIISKLIPEEEIDSPEKWMKAIVENSGVKNIDQNVIDILQVKPTEVWKNFLSFAKRHNNDLSDVIMATNSENGDHAPMSNNEYIAYATQLYSIISYVERATGTGKLDTQRYTPNAFREFLITVKPAAQKLASNIIKNLGKSKEQRLTYSP